MFQNIFIAISLAMDAFSVSLSAGASAKKIKIFLILKMAVFFGFFQMAMPVLGWALGSKLKDLITSTDHWLAFSLLLLIGLKMILDSRKKEGKCPQFFETGVLCGLAIATSIDALVVGITFAFLKTNIFLPVVLIGIITFSLSFGGVFLGKKFGELLGKKAGIVGGIILILIGLKILIEHLIG